MPKIHLINHTTWDSKPICRMLDYLAADLPIRQPFAFLLQHVWTELAFVPQSSSEKMDRHLRQAQGRHAQDGHPQGRRGQGRQARGKPQVVSEFNSMTVQIVPGTEKPDLEYDGTCWDGPNSRFVRVCVSPMIEYPVDWDIDPELPGKYLRFMTAFQDCGELLLYLAAHECRHLWQYEQPAEAETICQLLKMDFETDADFYALRKLCEYRQKPGMFYLSH